MYIKCIYKCILYINVMCMYVYIYIYVQPNMVNLLAITFCYFSDEHLTKLDGGRGLAPVDGHCSNKRLKAGCFFSPRARWT